MTTKVWVELTNQYRQTIESRKPTIRPKPEEVLAALEAIQALLMAIGHMAFWGFMAGIRLRSLAEIARTIFDYADRDAQIQMEHMERKTRLKPKATAQGTLIPQPDIKSLG